MTVPNLKIRLCCFIAQTIKMSPKIQIYSHLLFQHWYSLFPLASAAAAAAKSLQWCPALCDPTDGSSPDSPVPGILQARTLEWVAISFSNAWKWCRLVLSNPQLPHGLQPSRLLRSWDFPGKSTRVGCHRLLPLLPLNLFKSQFFSGNIFSWCHCWVPSLLDFSFC